MITEHQGDLFTDAPLGASLAHCVSADLAMGKGIALTFKKRFQQLDVLHDQQPQVGATLVLPNPEVHGAYVFYLVTKERAFDKPSLRSLAAALDALREACRVRGVTTLAMPRIGTGLDRLDWAHVRRLLEAAFAGSGIALHVYRLTE